MRNFVFCFCFWHHRCVLQTTGPKKFCTLMEAQGLVKMFEQQMAEGKLQGKKQAQTMMDQLMSGLNPSKEFDTRLRLAFEEFMKALEPTWTAHDIVGMGASLWRTWAHGTAPRRTPAHCTFQRAESTRSATARKRSAAANRPVGMQFG
ncbi:MAG: hypothetical protein IPO35_11505 [Uliginosibacterium sp.]|nr:hypothetical protein [Uliginosibacterium sp.]